MPDINLQPGDKIVCVVPWQDRMLVATSFGYLYIITYDTYHDRYFVRTFI